MTDTPETIYLIPGEYGEGRVWSEDPAPSYADDPADAVEYVRADAYESEAEVCSLYRDENEQLRARVAELESMKPRVVSIEDNKGFILSKQAEATEIYSEALERWLNDMPGSPHESFSEGVKAACEQAMRHAQRLRDEADKAGGEQ